MGQSGSKDRQLFTQMLKAMLRDPGSHVRAHQLEKFLAYVQDTCPWFPEEGITNSDPWQRVGEQLHERFTADGQESVPVETFSLWGLVGDTRVLSGAGKGRTAL